MNKPELYLELQRLTNYEIKKELDNTFVKLLKWRSDKKDSWLDIGCGPGTVIPEYLIPLLPETFTKFVGADISDKMIKFANKNYIHPKLSFRLMDIEDDNIEIYLLNENERFDHISCLFVLHCISNQAMTFKNIYNLLEPNGDCIFIFCTENTVFDAHFEINKNKKWQKYLSHLENKLGYYRGIRNANDEISKFLNLAGFVDYKIDIKKNQKYNFSDFQEFQNAIMSVDQYIDHVPEDLKNEYLNDMLRQHFPNYDVEKDTISYHLRYDLVTVYAKK